MRTAYKWLKRFKQEGADGLLDRPSRPRCCRHATPWPIADQVLQQRRSRRIYHQTAPLPVAPSTIARLVRRADLHRLADLEPTLPESPYEYAQPGQLLHLGIKKLARFHQPGHRIMGNWQINSDGIGWEYVHLAIDDNSRRLRLHRAHERGIGACRTLLRAIIRSLRITGRSLRARLDRQQGRFRSWCFPSTCPSPRHPSSAHSTLYAAHRR